MPYQDDRTQASDFHRHPRSQFQVRIRIKEVYSEQGGRSAKKNMRTFISCDGLSIRVGENAEENQRLCKQAKQNDLWFHLEGQSSPHAILSVGGGRQGKNNALRSSLHECQQLVKHFSSAR